MVIRSRLLRLYRKDYSRSWSHNRTRSFSQSYFVRRSMSVSQCWAESVSGYIRGGVR